MNTHPRQLNYTCSDRRKFLKATAIGGAAIATGVDFSPVNAAEEKDTASGRPRITIAGYQYDRVAGLADGRVQVEGFKTHFEPAKIGDMNTHAFSGPKTREVTEIGLLPFILAVANEEFRDYSLLPVFVLRLFRHKSIFIRNDRGISKPEDLRGRRVGTPGYSSSSLTWIRGIMQHEYGVQPSEIEWVVSAKDSSAKATGSVSKMEKVIPEGISIQNGPKGKDESDMLVDGDVDALFHPNEPRCFQEGHPKVVRLFTDSRATERDYFAKTGIFPIMHVVAVRNDVMQSHPELPRALFDAYSQAKQLAYDAIRTNAYYMTALPWIAQESDATRELMGDNYWPYGIEANRKTLEALLQYSYEQGLAKRKVPIEELFHPSTLDFNEDVPGTLSASPGDLPTKLTGQPNFRDLGGYKTSDGRTVKSGLIFRSGELPNLTNEDINKLETLGIKQVVNFLTDEEIAAHGADRLPNNVSTRQLPIAGGDAVGGGMAGAVLKARQTADFSQVPVELNPEIHRMAIREGTEQYAALLRELTDADKRPLVFHCSHGVHRTGTAAAILLSALGVPWETVRKDYLLSNEYRKDEVQGRLNQLRDRAAKSQGISPQQVDMTNINAFYILQPSYIDASLDEAVKQYGSMDNYIRDGLGIDNDLVKKLRDALLE